MKEVHRGQARKPGEQQQAEPGAGPEEVLRWRGAVPDEQDAEGHGIRLKAMAMMTRHPDGTKRSSGSDHEVLTAARGAIAPLDVRPLRDLRGPMGTGGIVAGFNGESAMRLVLVFVVLVFAVSVMACGSGGASSAAPSAQASAETPSASAVPASPSPSPSAVPSQPTNAPSAAIDLAALLPGVLAGTTLDRVNENTVFQPDPASDMGRMLGAVGASSADIRMASAYDPSGTLPVEIIALAFAGVSGDQIAAALDSVYAAGPDRDIEALEMAGTRVLRITAPGDATSRYVFVNGDVLFVILTADDALAAEAVTAIAE